jgi:uncharacterized metal-binding protein YceD (DUF177 family)
MPPASSPSSELIRPFPLARLTSAPLRVDLQAGPAERARIALRLGIVALTSLEASWDLRRLSAGVIEAQGRLRAGLTQDCVVTLDPFDSEIDEPFTVRFVPAADLEDDGSLDPETIDEIPYEGDRIDLGEATIEQLALGLDPFPRKPDASLPEEHAGARETETDDGRARIHPFAALQAKRDPS